MIDIRIEQDYRKLQRNLDTLQRRAIRPALRSTIGRLMTEIRKGTIDGIADKVQIPRKHFSKKVRRYFLGRGKLGGKVWLGFKERVRVSKVAGMTTAKAQRYARWGPRVFQTKGQSGKKIFLQRRGASRYPIEEPQVDISKIGKTEVNRVAVEVFRNRYAEILSDRLKRRLERRNLFDLRALSAVQEILED